MLVELTAARKAEGGREVGFEGQSRKSSSVSRTCAKACLWPEEEGGGRIEAGNRLSKSSATRGWDW